MSFDFYLDFDKIWFRQFAYFIITFISILYGLALFFHDFNLGFPYNHIWLVSLLYSIIEGVLLFFYELEERGYR